MLSKPVEIYGLKRIGDETIRYIGRTSAGCKTRLRQHKSDAKKLRLPVHRWIVKHGFQIEIVLLETVPVGGDWALAEQEWIAGYRVEENLLNISDGGEGPNGYKPTGDHLRKLREVGKARRTRKPRVCKKCGGEFEAAPNLIEKGFAKYCSRECKDMDHGNNVSVKHTINRNAIEAARQRRLAITHCPQGHPYEGDNLIRRAGRRICRICSNEATRVYQARKRGSDPYNTKPQRKPWTVEEIHEEALKYTTRRDFSKKAKGAYLAARSKGILQEVCSHMQLLRKDKNRD